MTSVVVRADYIGSYDQSGFYRVDLSQSGLASIRSFTIFDDNQIHAGTGAASGFDLDFGRDLDDLGDDRRER